MDKRLKFRFIKIAIFIIIFTGIGILAYPFIPLLKYKITNPEPIFPYQSKLLKGAENMGLQSEGLPEINNQNNLPKDNRLVIPKIGVDTYISSHANESIGLSQGVWQIPNTSSPDQGGNTVISGHRFRFKPPNNTTFYLLNELEKGDNFIVYWRGQEYDYVVKETKVVKPDQVQILDNTEKSLVTLFTCSPLFTTKERLVVIGELI